MSVGRSACVVAMLMLAGCSGDESLPDEQEAVDDVARAALIDVAINGSVQPPVNGTVDVPSGVNVTFNGTSSLGAEGNFTWDFGDNTTSKGPVAAHAFSPGSFEVTLTIGVNGTASHSLRIQATAPEPLSGVFLESHDIDASGNLVLGNPNTATEEGTDYRDHVVTIAGTTSSGENAVAAKAAIQMTSSGGAVNTFLYWISPSGETLASSTASSTSQEIEYESPMPPGDYTLRVRAFLGADVDYTVAGEIEYVTP